jgi:hypothetical protein
LALLKKHNFLATANEENVPLDCIEPEHSFFGLRGVTLEFESFPCLKRYSPKRRIFDVALDLFFDNPIVFKGHHGLFAYGIDAFNSRAEEVRRLQPEIEWKGLGYIARHMQLEKAREDGGVDVLAFSSDLILENKQKKDVIFYVQKEESRATHIERVTVNGNDHPYDRSEVNLMYMIHVPAGESRRALVEYAKELDIASVDISKKDLRVWMLRLLSDFRDTALGANAVGRKIVEVYYERGAYKLGLISLGILLLGLGVVAIFGYWLLSRRGRKRART